MCGAMFPVPPTSWHVELVTATDYIQSDRLAASLNKLKTNKNKKLHKISV